LADGREGDVRRRVLSALVMAPVALLAVYLGSPAFEISVAAVGVMMGLEWDRLCRTGGAGPIGAPALLLALVPATVCLAAGMARFDLAALVIAAGAAAVWFAVGLGDGWRSAWRAAGAVYVGVPVLALLWLRGGAETGMEMVFWLLGTVWATDIAAFLVGRAVGGPRFAPRISPSKTWAGVAGGLAGALLCGAAASQFSGRGLFGLPFFIGGLLGLAAESGDLVESAVKRRFGVKDSGAMIPGHGGLFDRLDSLLVAAPVLAGVVLALGAEPLARG